MRARFKTAFDRTPGVAAAFLLALPAWFLGERLPLVGPPVFAILLGMLLSPLRRPAALEAGIGYSGKKILQYAIILLGFGLDLGLVLRVGLESLAVMVFTLLAAFAVAAAVGNWLELDPKKRILVGVGTAICGGSAIAATAPVIEASEEDVAHSISTIFLFNIAAVFIFPSFGRLMGMDQEAFGLWAGTAINDTSSVVAAAFSYGDEAGRYATVVKLARTLMIIPITFGLALARARGSRRGARPGGAAFSLARVFPWFVLGFLAASLARSSGLFDAGSLDLLPVAGKFGICVAMAAIGLRSNPATLVRNGWKPIVLGLACWLAVSLTSLLVQSL